MTRPGRVEVYRTTRHNTRTLNCSDACNHSSPDILAWGDGRHLQGFVSRGWGWRFFAPNGVQIGRSSEAYERLRDLARNLEQCFPGYRLLDQHCGLTGPTWYLHGMEFAHPGCAAEIAIPEDSVMGVGMRGVRIPVSVPVGVWLGSRR